MLETVTTMNAVPSPKAINAARISDFLFVLFMFFPSSQDPWIKQRYNSFAGKVKLLNPQWLVGGRSNVA